MASKRDIRSTNLRNRYGLDIDAYEALRAAQGGLCAICREPCRVYANLTVDHSHKTTRIRGLTCSACNLGIGKLRDSPDIVGAALLYLIANGEPPSAITLGALFDALNSGETNDRPDSGLRVKRVLEYNGSSLDNPAWIGRRRRRHSLRGPTGVPPIVRCH